MATIEAGDSSLSLADLRLLPSYGAAGSGLVLLWTLVRSKSTPSFERVRLTKDRESVTLAFHFARLTCVLVLLVLSAFNAAVHGTLLAKVALATYVSSSRQSQPSP